MVEPAEIPLSHMLMQRNHFDKNSIFVMTISGPTFCGQTYFMKDETTSLK